MEKKNPSTLILVIVLIIVAIILFFTFKNKKEVTTTGITPSTEVVPGSAVSEPASTQDLSVATGSIGTAPSAITLAYADALVKYADRRIQLDKICQAHPNTVTYKDNTGIMIDNRSPQTRTIKVGTTFTIKPWGFKIVVLPDVYLKSKTILVDCDQSQNVATILVQE